MKSNKQNKSFDQINKEAGMLSSYMGGRGYESDFNGDLNAMEAAGTARVFQFVVTHDNTTASVQTLTILPGLGYSSKATIDDGVIRTNTSTAFNSVEGNNVFINCSGTPGSIEDFLDFISSNPSKILGLRFESTAATQLTKSISITKANPFVSTPETRNVILSSFKDEHSYSDKIVTVPFKEQADGQTKITIPVINDTTLTVSIFVGAIDNKAADFAKG